MAVNYTPIPSSTGVANTAALFNSRLQQLDNAIVNLQTNLTNVISGAQAIDLQKFSAPGTLTLTANVAGAVTVTKTRHLIDTFSAAASGDLATINGGTAGQMLILLLANAARVVTVKNGTGNIKLNSGADHVLETDKALMLFYNGTTWTDLSQNHSGKVLYRRVELAATAASITISSIPQIFTHLHLVIEARSTAAASTIDSVMIRPNNDATAANYYSQYIVGSAAAASASEQLGTFAGFFLPFASTGASSPAGATAISVTEILNYTSTTRRRSAISRIDHFGSTTTSTIHVALAGGTWQNTAAAITSLVLVPNIGPLFDIGTAVTLYGYLA